MSTIGQIEHIYSTINTSVCTKNLSFVKLKFTKNGNSFFDHNKKVLISSQIADHLNHISIYQQ